MYTAAWMYQPSLALARLAAMRSISSGVMGRFMGVFMGVFMAFSFYGFAWL